MARKEKNFITLRFRKKLDDDLKEAVSNLEDVILSDLVRDGLRLMLGIRTTKKIQVTETALSLPRTKAEQKAAKVPSKPAAPLIKTP